MGSNYVLRIHRIVFEFLPQTGDMCINRASVERSVFAPDMMQKLFARYDFTHFNSIVPFFNDNF